MKRKRLIIIFFGFLVVVVLAAALWPREGEPEYNGVALSEWLQRFNDKRPGAADAIRQIGTNGLPFLLRWIQYETPGWRNSLNTLQNKLPVSLQKTRPVRWLFKDQAAHRAELAVESFFALGPIAKPAAAELSHLMMAENANANRAPARATRCLIYITKVGPPGDFEDGIRAR